jgi:hypothetical protein
VVNIAIMTLKNFENYKSQTLKLQAKKQENTKLKVKSSEAEENELVTVTPLAIVYGKCSQVKKKRGSDIYMKGE